MPQKFTYNRVTRENLLGSRAVIKEILGKAAFVAIDAEFSGIHGRGTNSKDMGHRYSALSQVVERFAVMELGLVAFAPLAPAAAGSGALQYAAHCFSIPVACQKLHSVEPICVRFLADHGFDFGHMLRHGVPYWPGAPRDAAPGEAPKGSHVREGEEGADARALNAALRDIMQCVLASGAPLITHNGLIDLMFIYHHFVHQLPNNLGGFVTALSSQLSGGLYDTKHLAETLVREPASYLSYLFRRYERVNGNRAFDAGLGQTVEPHFTVRLMPPLPSALVDMAQSAATRALEVSGENATPLRPNKRPRTDDDDADKPAAEPLNPEGKSAETPEKKPQRDDGNYTPFCVQYAAYGFCKRGRDCPYPHDLALILDEQMGPARGRATVADEPASSAADAPSAASYHSAAFDAFMTGYVFAAQATALLDGPLRGPEAGERLRAARNCIYLMGKDIPLRLEPSQFAE